MNPKSNFNSHFDLFYVVFETINVSRVENFGEGKKKTYFSMVGAHCICDF